MIAGDQVPSTPLGEVFDKVGAEVPSQKGTIGRKFGVKTGTTVIDNVVNVVETH